MLTISPPPNILELNPTNESCYIANEIVLLPRLIRQRMLPEHPGLDEIIIYHRRRERSYRASPGIMRPVLFGNVLGLHGDNRRVDVVRVPAVVSFVGHEAIALVGLVDLAARRVAGELLVVGTDTVACSVRVGEHAGLEHCTA